MQNKKNREYHAYRDTFLCLKFRLKQIVGEPKHLLPLFFLFLFLLASIGVLKDKEEEKSRIPIGISVDGEETSELVKRLQKQSAFAVVTGTKKEMKELLNKGEIQLLFEIPEDLFMRIKKGNTKGMITVIHRKGDTSNTVLSDIVTGEFMDEICSAAAKSIYRSIGDEYRLLPMDEYVTYENEIKKQTALEYHFDIQVLNLGTKENVTEQIGNVFLYRQVLFSILLVLLSFFLLFAAVGIVAEEERLTERRFSIGMISSLSRFLGNFLAVFLIGIFLGAILCAVWFALEQTPPSAAVWISIFILLYLFITSLFLLWLGRLCKSVILYQFAAAVCIFAGGIGGFFQIVSTLLPDYLLKISKFTLNNWFIQGITDIMINGRLLEKGEASLTAFAVMGTALIILLWVQEKKRQRS